MPARMFRLPPPCGEGWGGGRGWYTLHHPSLFLPIKGRGPECKDSRAAIDPTSLSARWCRGGMTLIELLLVLALLVVIGSMVVPVFTGSFASVRLRRAGDQVLTRWAAARARAIETGEVMQFRFTPETGTYQVEPWAGVIGDEPDGARAVSSSSYATADIPDPTSTAAKDDESQENGKALPEQIIFHRGDMAMEDPLTGERRVGSMQSAADSQSTPILFFPDGTTSEASVVLANDRQQYIRLTLRALTGVGRVSEVLALDELQRAQRRR